MHISKSCKVPVAAYVRMSTEHQKYSILNQLAAINIYASENNLEIINLYSDEGKSGLVLKGRKGLQQMLLDVQSGNANFSKILVLDISRWGRFQDVDEGAYYEVLCRQVGIEIHYTDESFTNDATPISAVIKAIKRCMAGEYSRDLSKKVFAGQSRLAKEGYRVGGMAGYGLRRMLVGPDGKQLRILMPGERKITKDQHVILVPGPVSEIKVVNWIFNAFVNEGINRIQIANILNQRNIKNGAGRPWSDQTVGKLLRNEKYIGNLVFNRTSARLKTKCIINNERDWVKSDGAYKPILKKEIFYKAQQLIKKLSLKMNNSDLLDKLKWLHNKYGKVSRRIINDEKKFPCSCTYTKHFGSLTEAVRLIGVENSRKTNLVNIKKNLQVVLKNHISNLSDNIPAYGGEVRALKANILMINKEVNLLIAISQCRRTKLGELRWHIDLSHALIWHIALIVRMDANNKNVKDYYLFPAFEKKENKIWIAEKNATELDAYRFKDLSYLYSFCGRTHIKEIFKVAN